MPPHHWPDSGIECTAAVDPATNKTTCHFEHNLYKKDVFEAMPAPKGKCKTGGQRARSLKGGGAKGGGAKGGGQKGPRAQSPTPSFCWTFMRGGTCENGANCKFGHLDPEEAKRIGIEPPAKGKGRKGKTGPAQAQQQQAQQQNQQGNGAQGGTVSAHCAPRASIALSVKP